jgi:hypothetical protein
MVGREVARIVWSSTAGSMARTTAANGMRTEIGVSGVAVMRLNDIYLIV